MTELSYLDLPHRPSALQVEPPLKVLVMISSPSDYPKLEVEREWQRLKTTLDYLEGRGLLVLDCLEHASLSALQAHLRHNQVHIFHFICHFGLRQSDGTPKQVWDVWVHEAGAYYR